MSVCSSCGVPVRRKSPGKEGRPTDDQIPLTYERIDPFTLQPVQMVRRLCGYCKSNMSNEGWSTTDHKPAGRPPAH